MNFYYLLNLSCFGKIYVEHFADNPSLPLSRDLWEGEHLFFYKKFRVIFTPRTCIKFGYPDNDHQPENYRPSEMS